VRRHHGCNWHVHSGEQELRRLGAALLHIQLFVVVQLLLLRGSRHPLHLQHLFFGHLAVPLLCLRRQGATLLL
jgi:hypothetical protein